MPYEFRSTLFASRGAMLDAIAYEWMTAGGNNTPEQIDAMIEAGLTAENAAAECVAVWSLEEPLDGQDESHAERHGYTQASITAVMGDFFRDRPDRA